MWKGEKFSKYFDILLPELYNEKQTICLHTLDIFKKVYIDVNEMSIFFE